MKITALCSALLALGALSMPARAQDAIVAPASCPPGGGSNPIPEPGSLALLALGATVFGGSLLRRRK